MIKFVKDQFSYLYNLKFVKNIFTLQIGSFFGTGLSLIASVLLARILGAENYGNYALIFAFAGLVSILMDWGVGYASLTLLPEAYEKNDIQEVKNILTYFFKLNLIIVFSIGSLLIVFSPYLSKLIFHNAEIGSLARLIILASITSILFSLLVIMLQVLRKIKYLTVIENINRLFLSFIPITLVLLGFGLWGIVWGHFLTSIFFMFFSLWVYHNFSLRNKLVVPLPEIFRNFSKVKISKYFKFGFNIAVDKNISKLFTILPLIFLGFLSTPSQVANLKIAIAYLSLPKVFLSPIARLLQVQLPKAKVAGVKYLKSNFYKSAFYSGVSFVPLVVIFILFAPFLIKLFYGTEFTLSITLVYPLSLTVIFAGFKIGYGSFYRTVNEMFAGISINVINLIVGISIFIILLNIFSPLFSIIAMLIFWSLFSLVVHSLYLQRVIKRL